MTKQIAKNTASAVKWLAQVLTLLALIHLSGLDRAVVQVYAWSSMILDRLPNQSVERVITETFSGDHPCHICEALAEVEEKEKQAPAREETLKTLSFFERSAAWYRHHPASRAIPRFISQGPIVLMSEVATPPPQFV